MRNPKMACQSCDLLIELPKLQPGDEARCPRCDHVVASQVRGGLPVSMACLLAAAVMFVLAMCFPFLAFESRGLSREIALWQVATELYSQGMPLVAVAVGALVIGLPALLLLIHLIILGSVLSHLKVQHFAVVLLRWSCHLRPWNMVEIFAVGTLASLTKIASLATVVFGVSFWAYLAFSLLLAISMLHFDRRRIWSLIKLSAGDKQAARANTAVEVVL